MVAYSSGNEVHLAQKRPPSFKRSRGGHRQRQAYRQHVNQRVFMVSFTHLREMESNTSAKTGNVLRLDYGV